jgi:hypothetical protein
MVVDKKLPKVDERLGRVSEFSQAYGPNLGLTLVVDETLASNVLEAYLFISSDPREQHMELRFPDQRYQRRTLPKCVEEFRMLGPADIRRKIVLHSLSPICNSRIWCMHAFSIFENGFVPWTGPCLSAKEDLWTDVSKNIQLCPRPNEWILISGYDGDKVCWQEVLRGSYTLFYAIICHPLARMDIQLTSTSCLLCSLDSHQSLNPHQRNMSKGYFILFKRCCPFDG